MAQGDDYRDLLFKRFGERAKSFVKQFTILNVFAFAFLAFILVPMVTLKRDDLTLAEKIEQTKGLQGVQKAQETQLAALKQKSGELTAGIEALKSDLVVKQQEAAARERDLQAAQQQLAENERESTRLESVLDSLKQADAQMSDALKTFVVEDRVDDLRGWFRNGGWRRQTEPACQNDPDLDYLPCMVREKLQSDWDAYFELVARDVIRPLSAVDRAAAEAIEPRLRDLRAEFDRRLIENPDFWRTVNEKGAFMEDLAQELDQSFDKIRSVIGSRAGTLKSRGDRIVAEKTQLRRNQDELRTTLTAAEVELARVERGYAKLRDEEAWIREEEASLEIQVDTLSAAIPETQEELDVLLAQKDRVEDEKLEIEKRMSNFQSPFGTLPVGLKEAVLTFPLILAAGFAICAFLLQDLIRLRREIHQRLGTQRSTGRAEAARTAALLAPLWLEPQGRVGRNFGMALLLLLPAAAFALSGLLIAYDWSLEPGAGLSVEVLRPIYGGLYLLGAALVAIGIRRVLTEVFDYRISLRDGDAA